MCRGRTATPWVWRNKTAVASDLLDLWELKPQSHTLQGWAWEAEIELWWGHCHIGLFLVLNRGG